VARPQSVSASAAVVRRMVMRVTGRIVCGEYSIVWGEGVGEVGYVSALRTCLQLF
jgi:hypothetical protein